MYRSEDLRLYFRAVGEPKVRVHFTPAIFRRKNKSGAEDSVSSRCARQSVAALTVRRDCHSLPLPSLKHSRQSSQTRFARISPCFNLVLGQKLSSTLFSLVTLRVRPPTHKKHGMSEWTFRVFWQGRKEIGRASCRDRVFTAV